MFENQSNKLLLVILVLATASRLLVIFIAFGDYSPSDDAMDYHMMAQNFLAGRGLIIDENKLAFRTPLTGLYVGAIYSVFGVSYRAVQFINVLLGVLTVWLAYDFVRRSFGVIAARWSALFVSIYPMLLFYTGHLLSETLFVLLVALALWSTWILRDRRSVWFSMVGIILGLAVLTRPTALPIAVLIAGWAVVGCFSTGWPQRISRPLIILLFTALTLVPWTLRNYAVLGKFIPFTSDSGTMLWIANNPLADGTAADRVPYNPSIYALPEEEMGAVHQKLAMQFIRENPTQFLRLALRRLLYFWHLGYHGEGLIEVAFLASYLPMLALGLIGVQRGWRSSPYATSLLLVVPVSLTAVHMVFLPAGRYRLPAELVLCVFAGLGLCWITSKLFSFKSLGQVSQAWLAADKSKNKNTLSAKYIETCIADVSLEPTFVGAITDSK